MKKVSSGCTAHLFRVRRAAAEKISFGVSATTYPPFESMDANNQDCRL